MKYNKPLKIDNFYISKAASQFLDKKKCKYGRKLIILSWGSRNNQTCEWLLGQLIMPKGASFPFPLIESGGYVFRVSGLEQASLEGMVLDVINETLEVRKLKINEGQEFVNDTSASQFSFFKLLLIIWNLRGYTPFKVILSSSDRKGQKIQEYAPANAKNDLNIKVDKQALEKFLFFSSQGGYLKPSLFFKIEKGSRFPQPYWTGVLVELETANQIENSVSVSTDGYTFFIDAEPSQEKSIRDELDGATIVFKNEIFTIE